MFVRSVTILIALLAWAGAAGTAEAEIKLRFGLYASDKPSEMVRKFRPVLNALEAALTERLGEPVKITTHIASSYEDGVAALVSGKVDFTRFGPASYVTAKAADPGISILAMESVKGQKTFRGVIAVHRDSPVQSIADLRGRRFAFGDPRSTIGRYLSQMLLLQHRITGADLGGYDYLGRHDKVGMAVAVRQFDAGALKESTFKKLVAAGRPLRELASFPNVTKPWLARGGLAARTVGALRRSLLAMRDPAALRVLKKDGFLPGEDQDFQVIRDAMQTVGAFKSTS